MKSIIIGNPGSFSYALREALRTLKTNIKFSGDDIKVIMLTSAAPNEGKSSVTFNLAKSLTESGKNVLIIDSDMRKSVLVGRLQARSEDGEEIMGLSHYLSGQQSIDDTTYKTDIENLYVMFAGPSVPNPTELLEKKYFSKLIKNARDCFDYVLIDTAPLGAAIDAAIVARHCDATLLVVAQGTEPKKNIMAAKSQIEAAGGKIIGVVLNKVNVGKIGYGKYYGGYYSRYYGRYYGQDEEKHKKHTGLSKRKKSDDSKKKALKEEKKAAKREARLKKKQEKQQKAKSGR